MARDERGYVLTGPDLLRDEALRAWPLERPPALFETSVPGYSPPEMSATARSSA